MEWVKIKHHKNGNTEIDFEDEVNILNSLRIIKAEYFRKTIKAFISIFIILALYTSYLIYGYYSNIVIPNSIRQYSFNLTAGWTFFNTSVFLIIYLIKLIRIKFTPSLIYFMKKEVSNIGFEFQKRYTSGLLFLMLNTGAIALLIYIDFHVIQFNGSLLSKLLQNLIILYLVLSLALPIIWVFINDKFVAMLKPNFFVLFDFHYKIRRRRDYEPFLVGIYLTSNRLCSRFNKSGKIVHTKISEIRWLPRKGKFKHELNPYLHFHEFSVPINFQKQFLNIALALNEWNTKYINTFLYNNTEYLKRKNSRFFSNESQLLSWKFLRGSF